MSGRKEKQRRAAEAKNRQAARRLPRGRPLAGAVIVAVALLAAMVLLLSRGGGAAPAATATPAPTPFVLGDPGEPSGQPIDGISCDTDETPWSASTRSTAAFRDARRSAWQAARSPPPQ